MIQINHLKKKFDHQVIFDDYSLTIQQGEFIAIVGKSGCGKSTLLNMIGLLDQTFDGEIIIDNVSIKKLSLKKRLDFIGKHIAYLFQNYALIDDESVRSNMMYVLDNKQKNPDKIIDEKLQLLNLELLKNKKVYQLSGGEQQRVALARALLKDGDIVLADEPTGNLDQENKKIVMETLKMMNDSGKTVVVVTHDLEVAKIANRVIEL